MIRISWEVKRTENGKMTSFHSWTDDRHPGLVVIWQEGTKQIALCRVGGPNGNIVLHRRRPRTINTYDDALAAAERWFDRLGAIFETVEESVNV